MKKTSVLLVDDHSVVRMGLAAIINIEKDLKVCGEAESGAEAVKLASEMRPDVVVMDFMMPGMDGAEATEAVLRASPESKVLVLTTYGTSVDIARALKCGATGAVTKNLSNEELADAPEALNVVDILAIGQGVLRQVLQFLRPVQPSVFIHASINSLIDYRLDLVRCQH